MVNIFHEKRDGKRPVMHSSSEGTYFYAKHADFSTGVIVIVAADLAKDKFARDVGEMICWHVNWIHPTLNYFSGYDAVKYHIIETDYPLEFIEELGGDTVSMERLIEKLEAELPKV